MDLDLDFVGGILDEVALEGLDGITLKMLWQRLSDRPRFSIKVDENSKKFLWNCVTMHKDIEMYLLPVPRPFAPIIDRYDFIDPELGVVMEFPTDVEDPYPIDCVKDGDIRGSCATYHSRQCITSEIRSGNDLLLSLSEAEEKWDDSLVFVASPKVRLLALIGTETNPLIDLSLESYCLLERIGRSRYLGEVTQGVGGLLSTKAIFCKQLHYYRKKLSVKGLITKQTHYLKTRKGNTMNGSLFHLSRFYVQRKTKMASIMKKLCDILKDKPKQREVSKKLRDELNIKDRTFKKLFYRPFQRWVRLESIPFHEMYPDAPRKDWFTMHGHEKIAKVVQMVKHCDEEDDEEEDMIEEEKKALPLNTHFDFSRIRTHVPLVLQVYRLVMESGPEGVSSSDIGRILTTPRLDTRTLLRILLKKNLVVAFLQDRGRQKVTKYVANKFANQNEAYSSLQGQDVISVPAKPAAAAKPDTANDQVESSKRKASVSDDDWVPQDRPKKKRKATEKKAKTSSPEETATPEMDIDKESLPVPSSSEELPSGSNFQNIVSQVLEIQNQSHFTGKAPKLICLSDQPASPSLYSGSFQLTHRKVKRSNLILDYLKSQHFTTLSDLQKYISDKEKEEGYNFKLDKKSTQRLVYGLHNSKKIKIFKAVLKLENEQTAIEFICDTSFESSDPRIQIAIEQAKFKYFSVSKDASAKKSKAPESELSITKPVSESQENKLDKMLLLKEEYERYPTMSPKFCRTKALHMFLYYLVYSHKEGDPASNDQRVYHDSMSWKRFVPPLPHYGKEGWCYLADIYSRMPLSLFVKVVNFRHGVLGLSQFLDDREKAHYLIKYLPPELRNNLLYNRKYLFSTNDVIRLLCYMGLVSMGPQVGKQKDQVFLYIHKRGSLRDTSISAPGYIHVQSDIEYESKLFEFKSESDLENYWLELESVCFHTPLGKFSAAVGKTISITDPNYKPGLVESFKNKSFDNIVDDGAIPGDGLGAAGFDSVLFLHSRRNWQSSSGMKPQAVLRDKMNSGPVMHSIQDLLKKKEMTNPDQKSRLHRLSKSTEVQLQKENNLKMGKGDPLKAVPRQTAEAIRTKKKTKVRTIKMRSINKKRCPYYDEKDKAAIEKLDKARCDWSTQEDSFLLLCKVASSFLEPNNKKSLVVPYTVVRDLLYEYVPGVSATKSSRACQRRLRYMMMNPTTVKNVSVFLGEAQQDSELVKEFDKPKPPRNKVEMWEELFTSILRKLTEKFTKPASYRCENQVLPDTLGEFWSRYEYVPEYDLSNPKRIYTDPKDTESIKKFVLNSLVLSAMAIGNDGAQWSYLLHKLYQDYSETVLQSVVTHLRCEKVIAVKKKSHRSDIQRSLRSTCPYKFSITYLNALLTKVPIKIFKESRELLNSLKGLSAEAGVELKGDVPPGYAAGVLALVMMDQLTVHTKIPNQIILFDSTLSKEAKSTIVERMINTLSDQESRELTELLGSDASGSISQKTSLLTDPGEDDISMDVENDSLLPSSQLSERNFQNASRFALYLLRREMSQPPIERVQHSQDYIILNSCRVFCRLKSVSRDFMLPTTPIDLVLKEEDVKPITSHCISDDRITLSEHRIQELSSSLKSYISPDSFKIRENYDDLFAHLYQQYSPQTLVDGQCIFTYIFQYMETGVPEKELWLAFTRLPGELSLFEHIRLLCKNSLVLRVGVVSFRYVCCCFARNWVLKSFHIPGIFSKATPCLQESAMTEEVSGENSIAIVSDFESAVDSSSNKTVETVVPSLPDPHSCISCIKERLASEKQDSKSVVPVATFDTTATEVNFVARTWRNPDGTLNKPVFFNLLSTVLSHIISFPAVSSAQVCEQFLQVMPPVQTLELIEVLEKASCVYKYYTKAVKKCSLFSPRSEILVTENPDPSDLDHLEPFPDSLVKVAKLRSGL